MRESVKRKPVYPQKTGHRAYRAIPRYSLRIIKHLQLSTFPIQFKNVPLHSPSRGTATRLNGLVGMARYRKVFIGPAAWYHDHLDLWRRGGPWAVDFVLLADHRQAYRVEWWGAERPTDAPRTEVYRWAPGPMPCFHPRAVRPSPVMAVEVDPATAGYWRRVDKRKPEIRAEVLEAAGYAMDAWRRVNRGAPDNVF